MSQLLTYDEQLKAAEKAALKARNAEAVIYYRTRGGLASASFETFKGSWAYQQWIARADVVAAIILLEDSYNWRR